MMLVMMVMMGDKDGDNKMSKMLPLIMMMGQGGGKSKLCVPEHYESFSLILIQLEVTT